MFPAVLLLSIRVQIIYTCVDACMHHLYTCAGLCELCACIHVQVCVCVCVTVRVCV